MIKPILQSIAFLSLLGCVVMGMLLLIIRAHSGNPVPEGREIAVTQADAKEMRNADFPVTVTRMFEASAYGGWHGDGEAVTIYKFPPHEAPALIQTLKTKNPDYEWRSGSGKQSTPIDGVREVVPRDFLPDARAMLLFGKPIDGSPMHEYMVDEAHGVLYSITNRY